MARMHEITYGTRHSKTEMTYRDIHEHPHSQLAFLPRLWPQMVGPSRVSTSPKTWIQRLRTNYLQKQQWNDSSETELRSLARPSSAFTQDTSYRSHSMRAEEASSIPASTTYKTYSSIARYTTGWRFGAINVGGFFPLLSMFENFRH